MSLDQIWIILNTRNAEQIAPCGLYLCTHTLTLWTNISSVNPVPWCPAPYLRCYITDVSLSTFSVFPSVIHSAYHVFEGNSLTDIITPTKWAHLVTGTDSDTSTELVCHRSSCETSTNLTSVQPRDFNIALKELVAMLPDNIKKSCYSALKLLSPQGELRSYSWLSTAFIKNITTILGICLRSE